MTHTDPRRRKSTTAKRRRASPDALHALAGAISRERDALPADSPRRRPSLPTLKFLRDAEGTPP